MRDRAIAGCWTLMLLTVLAAPVKADTFDLHWFWEQRCEDCHGHAGAFARKALSVEDGRLVGRHHRDDLMLFLGNHGVPAERVKPVYDMLLAQAGGESRFKDACGACHESAVALVRNSVLMRDGVLTGRETGRPVADFMKRHGNIPAEERPFFVDLLARVEREVHSPY